MTVHAMEYPARSNVCVMDALTSQHIPRCDEVQYMIDNLTPDELELAAHTCYEYTSAVPEMNDEMSDDGSSNSSLQRAQCASVMIRRYLNSKGDRDTALQCMKATLSFRKEADIEALVRCSASHPSADQYVGLRRFLSTKQSFVQGYDRSGRSTYIFIPRLVQEHNPEWTLKGHLWSLERAIACSKASDKTVNFAVDFTDFDALKHAPPFAVGKEIMLTLRNHYVGHVNRILLVNAPAAFVFLWAFFKHFAGSKTRDKIHFVNSSTEQETIIGDLYSPEQATNWMLPLGKKNRDLDLDEYLDRTPFDRAFDDEC